MFNPSQSDVRSFFFDLVEKAESAQQLTPLERIAWSVILEHPEYRDILHNREKYFDYQWTVEMGQTNPFLHLSMHLSIIEQLSIDQPVGIKDLFEQLCHKFGGEHPATHELMDCLAEMLWQAQSAQSMPDMQVYFECIRKKLGIA